MTDTKILSLKDQEEWSSIYEMMPIISQDIYFTPEYYRLYEELGDGKARCFIYEKEGSIALYPFLINSINELGYDLGKPYFDIQGAYGYNGVVANNYSDSFRSGFYKTFEDFCHDNNIIAEFTRFHPLLKNHSFSDGFLTIVKIRNTVFLDLSKSYDEVWLNEYSSKNRNMIRKAQKNKFSIYINEYPVLEKIKSFVKLYQAAMKAINAEKYYLFNEVYFINTFQSLGPNSVLFEAIDSQKKVACAAIIFIYGIYAHYHLSGRIQGSDNSDNNFILDEAIKYSVNKGAKYFHFGGGTTSLENDTLLKFKLNFSNTTADWFFGKKIHNENVYNEVIKQWEKKNPALKEKYKNILLKYRFTS